MVAITGLFWGWLIFHEHLSLTSATAAALIIAGILVVAYRPLRK